MSTKMIQGLKQNQNLVMSPQLHQSIKLLALSHLDVAKAVAEEMVENPMLEEVSAVDSENSSERLLEERLERENGEARPEHFEGENVFPKDDFDWQNYIEMYNSNAKPTPQSGREKAEDGVNYENVVSRGRTLSEHLEWQLKMEDIAPEEYQFALEIIHDLGDDGLLSSPWAEFLTKTRLTPERAQEVWKRIKHLDPVGCASESMRDCLLTQAQVAEERSPLLEKIITRHLSELQEYNYPKIAKALGVNLEQVAAMAKLLKSFHPKPGRLVGGDETHYIIPDVYVVQVGDEFVVKVNDEGIPRLRISRLYRKILQQKQGLPESKYVKEKLDSALWLMKSIQHRQKAIYRVARSIVREQQAFFKRGPAHLRPLIMRDIARQIGVHESTVSRVTSGKYMHTPIGIFELKYFFSTGPGKRKRETPVPGEVLKFKIKKLIEGEDPKKPLSDKKLTELLEREKIKVARRTVAKYREELGILPSPKRRKI